MEGQCSHCTFFLGGGGKNNANHFLYGSLYMTNISTRHPLIFSLLLTRRACGFNMVSGEICFSLTPPRFESLMTDASLESHTQDLDPILHLSVTSLGFSARNSHVLVGRETGDVDMYSIENSSCIRRFSVASLKTESVKSWKSLSTFFFSLEEPDDTVITCTEMCRIVLWKENQASPLVSDRIGGGGADNYLSFVKSLISQFFSSFFFFLCIVLIRS